MIIFDYGGTLCSEQDWDDLRAERTLLGYAAVNPGGYTAEDVMKDKEGLQIMRNLARNMTFLTRAIAESKEKYGLPEKESWQATHFIRGDL